MTKKTNMSSQKRAHLARLVRFLAQRGFTERSIYRWLQTNTEPRSEVMRQAWRKALADARKALARERHITTPPPSPEQQESP